LKAQILKTNILTISLLILFSVFIKAQDAESFFPHNIGDRWDYIELHNDYTNSYFTNGPIVRDSIGPDGSHNLFYSALVSYPQFRIDAALNVFEMPQDSYLNYLLYKLDADTGDVWENPMSGSARWAWVSRIESSYVFSQPTIIKVFRYGPAHPDSVPGYPGLLENWLASGFGLIYSESESAITYLNGCIVAGDTFGIVTSIEDINTEIPTAFILNQNYPNPFNPSTTISFEIFHPSNISLIIYDVLGKEVYRLIDDKEFNAGEFRVVWNGLRKDGSKAASGIYFYRLVTDTQALSRSMILLK